MSVFLYNGKQIYYDEIGNGRPLLILHGNTVSSKMFDSVLELYTNDFKVIAIDFLGHGNSERLERFTKDFWYDEAQQVIAFIEEKQYFNCCLIGTSGGAIAGINVVLERPDLVCKIIADSFMGEVSDKKVVSAIVASREMAKKDNNVIGFWKYQHGENWEQVIDNDTMMITQHTEQIKNYYHKELTELITPILLTASFKDDLIKDADKIAIGLSKKVKNGLYHIFDEGNHPALISNAKAFSEMAKRFFNG